MIAAERTMSLDVPSSRPAGWGAMIVGKGGTGKTTLAALLSLLLARDGETVLAIDADRMASLAYALGVPIDRANSFIPLSRNAEYIKEKIQGQITGGGGSSVEPDVDDVLERFAITVRDHLRLLVIGEVEMHVSGCRCPEHALMDAILRYLAYWNKGVMIMDRGGMSHPDGSASLFPHALILAEPSFTSLRIAERLTRQLLDEGIPHLHLVVNKIQTEQDVSRVKKFTSGLTCYEHVFSLPYDEGVRLADPDLSPLLDQQTDFMIELRTICRLLRETSVLPNKV